MGKGNKTASIVKILVCIFILFLISFYKENNAKRIKEYGVETEAYLVDTYNFFNTRSGFSRRLFKPAKRYIGKYSFVTASGEIYLAHYETSNRENITDSKIIYYNPIKVHEYVWEDVNNFKWIKEMFMALTELVFVAFIIFLLYLKVKKNKY